MNLFSLQGNWVDLAIILVLLYFASEAWTAGFWIILADFLSFFLSLIVSLRGYPLMAEVLRNNFSFPYSLSNALGFLFTAALSQAVFGYIFAKAILKLPLRLWKRWWIKLLSLLPALGEGLVLVSFVLTLVLALPIVPKVKRDVSNSKIGTFLVRQTQGVERQIKDIFGGVIEDSLTYLTVRPGSKETVPIISDLQELKEDEASEPQMFNLVNAERLKRGAGELTWAPEIVLVARAHAKDMWERQYFGHVSPEGEDVGSRLDKASINYKLAGENLALAPTVNTAHTGLMNSEGHRRNILEPKFKKVGIGVIDNGIYGKMFVQVFTD